jgi:hypothetical protein
LFTDLAPIVLRSNVPSPKINSWASLPLFGVMTMKRAIRSTSLKEDRRSELLIEMLDLPLS